MKVVKLMLVAIALTLAAVSASQAEQCQYQTDWGVLTLNYDYNTNRVTGGYPHKNGQVAGVLGHNQVSGGWRQSDGSGAFIFYLNDGGFTGYWNYSGQSGWEGEWNGRLLGCYQ